MAKFSKDNTGGTLRLSMSQSNNPDDAYTYSAILLQSLGNGITWDLMVIKSPYIA